MEIIIRCTEKEKERYLNHQVYNSEEFTEHYGSINVGFCGFDENDPYHAEHFAKLKNQLESSIHWEITNVDIKTCEKCRYLHKDGRSCKFNFDIYEHYYDCKPSFHRESKKC